MSDWPAEYHCHELKKLLGEYEPKGDMPCFQCDEPEAIRIRFAFVQFACAAHARMPRGTTPMIDQLVADTEPTPEPPPMTPVDVLNGMRREFGDPEELEFSALEDNLFMLRDYVLSGETIKAAAIKAAGGICILARKLGIQPEFIERWEHIPANRLQAVAAISGWPQHVLRPDLFPDVGAAQTYWNTKEEEDAAWDWSHARQPWLPLPYPPGFLPAHCCARRPRLMLVKDQQRDGVMP